MCKQTGLASEESQDTQIDGVVCDKGFGNTEFSTLPSQFSNLYSVDSWQVWPLYPYAQAKLHCHQLKRPGTPVVQNTGGKRATRNQRQESGEGSISKFRSSWPWLVWITVQSVSVKQFLLQ